MTHLSNPIRFLQPKRPVSAIGVARCAFALALAAWGCVANANFAAFNGGSDAESAWRAAVGPTALEDFESFANNTQIQTLPLLGLTFDELAGGGYPQAYLFGGTPHGPMHLGNFPNGINAINRWNDIIARPIAGFTLTAMGFWNGDGQADTLVAFAYDRTGNLLGSVGAFKGTFAGFISSSPVAWVRFEGDTGDGWNHLDGLQVNAVPEPAAWMLLLSGLGLAALRRFQRVAAIADSLPAE